MSSCDLCYQLKDEFKFEKYSFCEHEKYSRLSVISESLITEYLKQQEDIKFWRGIKDFRLYVMIVTLRINFMFCLNVKIQVLLTTGRKYLPKYLLYLCLNLHCY